MIASATPALRREWFRGDRNAAARARLLCFPFAAGGASLFGSWPAFCAEHLPGLDVVAVQLPGRENRLADEAPASLIGLAEALAEAALPLLDVPLVLFGISFGALVAYQTALALQRIYGVNASALVVCNEWAPTALPPGDPALVDGSDEAFLIDMLENGLLSREQGRDIEVIRLGLRALRTDYRLVATYPVHERTRIRAPIHAIHGRADGLVAYALMQPWGERCEERFSSEEIEAGHYALVDAPQALPAAVVRFVREVLGDELGGGA